MSKRNLSAKIGTVGERRAEFWFEAHGMVMFRTQPATRVVNVRGKAQVINCGSGGISDYTGYHERTAQYLACEVKTVHGKRCPPSKLSDKQHDFLASLPPASAWVGVYYIDHDKFIMYQYTGKVTYVLEDKK